MELPSCIFYAHIAPLLPIDTKIGLRVPPTRIHIDSVVEDKIAASLLSRLNNVLITHGAPCLTYLIPLPPAPVQVPKVLGSYVPFPCYMIHYNYSGTYVPRRKISPRLRDDAIVIWVTRMVYPPNHNGGYDAEEGIQVVIPSLKPSKYCRRSK